MLTALAQYRLMAFSVIAVKNMLIDKNGAKILLSYSKAKRNAIFLLC